MTSDDKSNKPPFLHLGAKKKINITTSTKDNIIGKYIINSNQSNIFNKKSNKSRYDIHTKILNIISAISHLTYRIHDLEIQKTDFNNKINDLETFVLEVTTPKVEEINSAEYEQIKKDELIQLWNKSGIVVKLNFINNIFNERSDNNSSDILKLVDIANKMYLMVKNSEMLLKKTSSYPEDIASTVTEISYSSNKIDLNDIPNQIALDVINDVYQNIISRMLDEGISFIIPKIGQNDFDNLIIDEYIYSDTENIGVCKINRFGIMLRGSLLLKPRVNVYTKKKPVEKESLISENLDNNRNCEVDNSVMHYNNIDDYIRMTSDDVGYLLKSAIDFDDPSVATDLQIIKDLIDFTNDTNIDNNKCGELLKSLRSLIEEHNVPEKWQDQIDKYWNQLDEWFCEKLDLEYIKPSINDLFNETEMELVQLIETSGNSSGLHIISNIYHGYIREGIVLLKAVVKCYEQ